MDSFDIAEYLEKTFPDAPSLFPSKSAALARLMESYCVPHLRTPLYPLILPKQVDFLDERGGEYFMRTREERLGPISHDVYKDKERIDKIWEQMSDGTGVLGQMLKDNPGGPYLLGADRSYADLELSATLEWLRVINVDVFERILSIQPAFRDLYDACKELL